MIGRRSHELTNQSKWSIYITPIKKMRGGGGFSKTHTYKNIEGGVVRPPPPPPAYASVYIYIYIYRRSIEVFWGTSHTHIHISNQPKTDKVAPTQGDVILCSVNCRSWVGLAVLTKGKTNYLDCFCYTISTKLFCWRWGYYKVLSSVKDDLNRSLPKTCPFLFYWVYKISFSPKCIFYVFFRQYPMTRIFFNVLIYIYRGKRTYISLLKWVKCSSRLYWCLIWASYR